MELEKRKYVIYTCCVVIFAIFVTRLSYLQLFNEEELSRESDKNSVKTITVTPPRGLMYDRNMKVLVDNKPSYTVTITPSQFDKNNLNEVAALLDIPPDKLVEILKSFKGTNKFNPAKIKRDVDFRSSLLEDKTIDDSTKEAFLEKIRRILEKEFDL